MKKRMTALFIALILTLFCLPLHVFAAQTSGSAFSLDGIDAVDESDDFARYGTSEEYAIVPCCAGGSAVDSGNGEELHLWRTHLKTNQIWTVGKVGDYYYIKSKSSGKVVDVPASKAELRTELICFEYHGNDNQLWRLESMGDGTYSIHSKLNDSLSWDVKGFTWNSGGGDNGTPIQLYTSHGEPNQRFRFVHTSTVEPMSEWGASRHDCNGSNWSVWDGSNSNNNWYDSRSSERDLYINSASDLASLANLVNNGWEMLGKTIHLMCDINLAGINWLPIGSGSHWFRGSFNGHNHAIVGLNRVDTSEDSDYTGLFGKVAGGTICNLAVKGTIAGDAITGGVVATLQWGHLCNIYSEVKINNCTDDRQGGICGEIGYRGLVDHCTQNASVYSTDYNSQRGGIAGYSDGTIRYCVNNANMSHNWDCGGGIAGEGGSGVFEFCANHGTISGGVHAEYIGGIVGKMNGGIILGCYNNGEVFSSDDDYVGGIVGQKNSDWNVICCINDGRVYGDDYIGGICGEGRPIKCLNLGVVTGDDEVGAISGNAKSDTPWCYALAYSAANLSGVEGSRAEWVTASEIISGRICYKLNYDPVTYDYYGITAPLSQNIGSDPMPTFGSAPVTEEGEIWYEQIQIPYIGLTTIPHYDKLYYANNGFQVKAECERGYGSIEGAGSYRKGDAVTLTAKPAAGCVFDHFEVKSADDTHDWTGFNGSKYYYPTTTVKTYKEDTITLTEKITKSYTVKAVFKIFDDTPEDMKVTVKLELECTNDADGWNNDTIPVALVDSAGAEHRWETSNNDLNSVGAKVDHTFDLGTTSPVAVYVYPNFGGGFTFHDYSVKARIWVNGDENPMVSPEVKINSYPFVSSIYGEDYMHISFENFGNSTVGGTSYTKCTDAWERAKSNSGSTIVLTGAWLLDSVLEVGSGQTVNLDLNGYPIIRTIKKTQDDGELFKINAGATLNISDSTPSRKSCGNFTGGSIQGGRSDDTGGLIECKGTLNMTGGTLYNGGTTDKGGAIKLTGDAKANLTGVLISNCWTDKAVFSNNNGGAIYMTDKATATLKNCTIRSCRAYDYGGGVFLDEDDNRLNCENVDILACSADDNQGGAVYQDHGETHWVGGRMSNCRAGEDNGGGFYQNNGKVYIENVLMSDNYSEDHGGAIYSDTDEGLWLIGCTLQQNKADDYGGAIYMNDKNLYLEDCSVISNTAVKEGGGIYVARSGSVGVGGTTVIRNNDGSGSMDNLVLGSSAVIYDHGLEPGSEIRLRSDSDGNAKLGGSLTSDYQLKQYFRADYGRLELTETKEVNTDLRASVFSGGYTALIIGAVVIVAALAGGLIYNRKRRKGGTQ